MPHISQLKESRFLTKEDCGRGILVTIKGCTEENVAPESEKPERKWCLHFHEQEKPMVLNITNGAIIAEITGSENTDDWNGHKIVLFHDPSIMFGPKKVGGIRARAPKQPQPAPQQPARMPVRMHEPEPHDTFQPGFDEDIPY